MKAKRVCMRDHVRDLIVSRIVKGTYPPGTRLKQLALAAECNVSQAPVREALGELEALGLVQSERYRGTRVRELDTNEICQAYELRAVLEERAAQLAVPCSAAVITELEKLLKRMASALQDEDFDSHAEYSIRYHRKIVEASGNKVFVAAFDNLHWEVRGRLTAQHARKSGIDFKDFMAGHTAILDALRDGDGVLAGKRIRELIERVTQQILNPPRLLAKV